MLPQNKRPPDISDYVNATSLLQAVEALADGNGTLLAGGSDLWAQKDSGNGRIRSRLVNINRVDELTGISKDDGTVRIGARVTMSDILASDLLASSAPLLGLVADRFASVQIRNVATIGGNIANASPAGDMALALLCLDGVAEVAFLKDGKINRRDVPLTDMFIAPGKTALATNELIVAVKFTAAGPNHYARFEKSGARPALEISMVAMCLTGDLSGGAFSNIKIAFGAVGPTPLRCPETEKLLAGNKLDDDLIARAVETMSSEISPIDDFRATAWYRGHMAKTFLEQELQKCR